MTSIPERPASVLAPGLCGPRTVPDIAVEEREGTYILLHPTRASYLVTNAAGLSAYRLADGTRTAPEILGAASEELGLSIAELEGPMRAFFEEVVLSGFLASPSGSAGSCGSPTTEGRDGTSSALAPHPHALPVRVQSLFFHLTNVCNIACTHCYRASGPFRPGKNEELSKERIFELVDELVELGGQKITFTGGEPLVRRDCLEILRYAGERVRLTLLTNAMLIDARVAEALAELPISIQVSLDGSTAEVHDAIRGRGSYERTLRGLDHLQRAGLGQRISLSASMLRSNLHDLPRLIPLAEQLEVPVLRFMPLHQLGRAGEGWNRIAPSEEEYLDFYRRLYFEGHAEHDSIRINTGFSGLVFPEKRNDPGHSWCPIGQIVTLKPNGDAYACALMMNEEDYIGNVREQGLGELQVSRGLEKAAHHVAHRREAIPECKTCNWRNFCQGSCTGLTRIKAGSPWSTDGFCELRRELYRRAVFGVGAT